MKRNRRWAAGVLALGVYGIRVRPRLLRWGATDAELAEPYPGDDIVPGGKRGATMAVTIEAPPSAVWPWLIQMGCDHAGWYSWDRLDNGGVASSDRLHTEWQTIAVGDRLVSSPSGRTWFDVAAAEPERFLALRASFDFRGRFFDPRGRRPRGFVDSIWCFQLTPEPRQRTRVVVSGYAAMDPVQRIFAWLFWEPAHWIMQTRQFTNLKRRAEREWRDRRPQTETNGRVVEPLRG